MLLRLSLRPTLLGLLTLILGGCDPAPPIESDTLTVLVPESGRVIVGEIDLKADPVNPAVFTERPPPPFNVTFVSDARRITLVDPGGETIDFSAFVAQSPLARRQTAEVIVRPEPWSQVSVRLLSDDFVYAPEVRDNGLAFRVPEGASLTLVALWQNETLPRVTVRDLGEATGLTGHTLSISPEVRMEGTLPVQILSLPEGWFDAELIFRGLKTGLMLPGGQVGPSRAATVATTRRLPDLSYWITVNAFDTNSSEPRRSAEAAVGVDRPSVALDWVSAPDANPRLRGYENPLPIGVTSPTWSMGAFDDAVDWFEVKLTAMGVCQPIAWRIIARPDVALDLPRLVAGNPINAPLVRGEIDAVDLGEVSLSDMLNAAPPEDALPRYSASRRRSTVSGYYEGRDVDCEDESDKMGRYTLHATEAQCDSGGQGDGYLIDRCGHLIRLSGEALPELCGQFRETVFDALGRTGIPVTVDENGALQLGIDGQRYTLSPVASVDAEPERALQGPWRRYEITEQGILVIDASSEIDLDDPLRIAAGDASQGPWLAIGQDGTGWLRTRFETAEITFESTMDQRQLRIDHSGCPGPARRLTLVDDSDGLTLHELLPTEVEDEFRRRVYRFWR